MPRPGRHPTPHPAHRKAYSLLELVLAIALAAGTLVPALALIRDGLTLSRETENKSLLATYAIGKLEDEMASVAGNWSATDPAPGDFSADGLDHVRYVVVRTLETAGDGDQLIEIRVTTYYDNDADDALDADEPSCVFRTKIGRFASYAIRAAS